MSTIIKDTLMIAAIVFVIVANYCKFKQTLGLSTGNCTIATVVDLRGCDDSMEWKSDKKKKEHKI